MAELIQGAGALQVQRTVKNWIRTCNCLPAVLTFENLPENDTGICFSTVQSPVYEAKYIGGGYRAQYRFQIIYRVLPSDDEDMIDAVDVLSEISCWCVENAPLISGAVNTKVEQTSNAAILTAYDDGTSDYGIALTLTWEVF